MSDLASIVVRGARVNNLKNVSFSIPLNSLTVVTGVSGSGKSSLAFDTIYAEGQRRYVESLSAYARQFLERMDKPDVDEVIGICPAIAINQKNSTRNPRSTVATQTEIYDYLRLLYARVGITICRRCGATVKRDTPQSVAETVSGLPQGTRFYVLFPAAAGTEVTDPPETPVEPATNGGPKPKKSRAAKASASGVNVKAHLMSLMQRGFTRLYLPARDEIIELQTPDSFTGENFDNTFVLVDRLVNRPDSQNRLVDSLEICYQEGHGQAVIQTVGENPQQLSFSEKFECKNCGLGYLLPEPSLFSFNNPFGACPICQGFGNTIGLDMNLVIPNHELSLTDGAIDPFTKPQFEWWRTELKKFARREGISMTAPFAELPAEHQRAVINGRNGFEGVKGLFDWLETKKYKLHIRVFLSKYRGYTICPECKGGRLRSEARDVYVGSKTLPEVCGLSIKEAAHFFESLSLNQEQAAIAERLLAEIQSRLRFLLDVGLDYLTLDRLASTLSGGEAQRIQLATHLGSSLVGALYVLDEPSIGLHPRDSARLIKLLQNLRDIGNTVLVVEHESEMMRAADHILDIGLGAGELGGEVVYEGDFTNLLTHEASLTGKYLRGETQIKRPKEHRPMGKQQITLCGAREHNLKGIDVTIPLNMLVCITGVSGSGKSTLVHDCIYAGLKHQRGEWQGPVGAFASLNGGKYLDDVILVDQSPIGRTPRSNPVTYIKVYDAIREAFASTREARARGYNASHFSFNVPGGRCDTCEGDGTVTVEMQFLADVELVCEECKGTRFKSSILDIKYRGKNIHEVLSLTVREALGFFSHSQRIAGKLKVLDDVGLGYLRLGQSATTLSGGEAQRVKLASYLTRKTGDHMLYIFDEPTTGLHFDDINKLLSSFRRLLDAGDSLIVIEHNLDVIKTADWIIDLGPEGGDQGGQIIATGTPESLIECQASHTGNFLKAHLLSLEQSGEA
ncbi:MAG TPA: excinuclease ABC subunit UvrA [Blastocatellia bacterium]|nr:excinuclease ABC subunit UvrA [Blastocatellia bacterium]